MVACMSDDWKGEHLISAKANPLDRMSEAQRIANAIRKRSGWQPSEAKRAAHGAFIRGAIRELAKVKP